MKCVKLLILISFVEATRSWRMDMNFSIIEKWLLYFQPQTTVMSLIILLELCQLRKTSLEVSKFYSQQKNSESIKEWVGLQLLYKQSVVISIIHK